MVLSRTTRPRRRVARSVVLAACLVLLPAGTAAPGAAAQGPGAVPHQEARTDGPGPHPGDGDQPLPGYTIDNPPLAPLTIDGRQTRVIQGVRDHAAYDIEVPPRWNGELVMWAHGYRGTGTVLTVDPPDYGMRQRLLEQGYAWAASSYARNAYDVATGVTTTRSLARYAGHRLGRRPERVYVAGVSMGGHVIGRSLEEYPRFYDGALPMCGVLGDQELFDYFLSYNLLAQDLADLPAYPPPADYATRVAPQIQARLGIDGLVPGGPDTANELGAQLRALTTELSGGDRPGAEQAFAVWKDFLFTLATPDNGGDLAANPGRIAQNVVTRYRPTTPVDVNRSVRRVAPRDLGSRLTRRLTQIPRIAGRPRVPTLTLHGLGDLFVPFSMEQAYARDVARHRQSDLLVQRAVRAAGHCEFTPAEVGRAWDDLTGWVESRDHGHGHGHRPAHRGRGHHHPDARPAGDDVRTPSVVADPTYGCEFTDPAGYESPELFPTRALYAPCPSS